MDKKITTGEDIKLLAKSYEWIRRELGELKSQNDGLKKTVETIANSLHQFNIVVVKSFGDLKCGEHKIKMENNTRSLADIGKTLDKLNNRLFTVSVIFVGWLVSIIISNLPAIVGLFER